MGAVCIIVLCHHFIVLKYFPTCHPSVPANSPELLCSTWVSPNNKSLWPRVGLFSQRLAHGDAEWRRSFRA